MSILDTLGEYLNNTANLDGLRDGVPEYAEPSVSGNYYRHNDRDDLAKVVTRAPQETAPRAEYEEESRDDRTARRTERPRQTIENPRTHFSIQQMWQHDSPQGIINTYFKKATFRIVRNNEPWQVTMLYATPRIQLHRSTYRGTFALPYSPREAQSLAFMLLTKTSDPCKRISEYAAERKRTEGKDFEYAEFRSNNVVITRITAHNTRRKDMEYEHPIGLLIEGINVDYQDTHYYPEDENTYHAVLENNVEMHDIHKSYISHMPDTVAMHVTNQNRTFSAAPDPTSANGSKNTTAMRPRNAPHVAPTDTAQISEEHLKIWGIISPNPAIVLVPVLNPIMVWLMYMLYQLSLNYIKEQKERKAQNTTVEGISEQKMNELTTKIFNVYGDVNIYGVNNLDNGYVTDVLEIIRPRDPNSVLWTITPTGYFLHVPKTFIALANYYYHKEIGNICLTSPSNFRVRGFFPGSNTEKKSLADKYPNAKMSMTFSSEGFTPWIMAMCEKIVPAKRND